MPRDANVTNARGARKKLPIKLPHCIPTRWIEYKPTNELFIAPQKTHYAPGKILH